MFGSCPERGNVRLIYAIAVGVSDRARRRGSTEYAPDSGDKIAFAADNVSDAFVAAKRGLVVVSCRRLASADHWIDVISSHSALAPTFARD